LIPPETALSKKERNLGGEGKQNFFAEKLGMRESGEKYYRTPVRITEKGISPWIL